ncbi:MAG: TonB family protein [Pseudomonadota bacterium]
MYYLQTGQDKHNRLRNAILLALAVHLAFIFSVSFNIDQDGREPRQIEVTLAIQPSIEVPDDAQRLAQANQQGVQAIQDFVPAASTPQSMAPPPATGADLMRDVPTTTARNRTSKALPKQQKMASLDGINPEVDRLNTELANLEAQLQEQTPDWLSSPRVRRLDATSARQSADAAYLLEWRKRLEAVGNQYYPEASVRYGFYGDLRLLVIILADGSLEDVQLLSSSGYAVLDEWAIKIVRMAAPYPPFSSELRATTDKLEIVRTWQFRENELSSNE